MRYRLLSILALAALGACNVTDAVRDMAERDATAYDRYARSLREAGLAETALGREWLAASDSALRAPLLVPLPLREAGFYSRNEARAVAYRFTLSDGQRLVVGVRRSGLPALLFLDLYEVTGDTARPFLHRRTADSASAGDTSGVAWRLEYEARRSGAYILRLQPELLRDGRYELMVSTEPSLAFPVQGGGNRSVRSFFGAERDAGRRRHHGIDIFAPRGTPVLAASDGVIRSTRPNELGGNVVWLYDEERRQTMYYAHLDAHAVQPGERVRAGDTVGFVGNSGNARTTPPHLHFGIYRRGEGPVDPFPFVRTVSERPAPLQADTTRLGEAGAIQVARTALLLTPDGSGDVLRQLQRRTPVQIMGAAGRWYRVQLEDGVAGYVAARVVGRAPHEGSTARRAPNERASTTP